MKKTQLRDANAMNEHERKAGESNYVKLFKLANAFTHLVAVASVAEASHVSEAGAD